MQRAQPAQRQEAVEGRAGETQAVGPPDELLVQRRVARDHRPADHVAVAVQVLGGRVHHEVGPEGERLLPGGREEGVVDHHERAGSRVRGRRTAAMSVMRSSGLLGVSIHSSAAGCDERGAHGGLVAEVDELDLPLAAAAPGLEQPVGAAVAVVRRDDAGARGHAGSRSG